MIGNRQHIAPVLAGTAADGEKRLRRLWLWSLGLFILAAATGLLYRLELLWPLAGDLSLANIRHAHSHLMFFCWVTPVPMIFFMAYAGRFAPGVIRPLSRLVGAIILLGAVSWPFFLLYGYRPVAVGQAELPLSVMLSGLVMLAWYGFIAVWIRYRHLIPASFTRTLYEGSFLMLVLSSMGAWGVAAFSFGSVDQPFLTASMTHLFLALFTMGWCLLSLFAVLEQLTDRSEPGRVLSAGEEAAHNKILLPILIGAPLTFPFGLPEGMVTATLLTASRIGALLVSAGALLFLVHLAGRRSENSWLKLPLLLGLITIAVLAASLFLPGSLWIGSHGVRVFYLHLLLLGLVTLGYFAAWHRLHPTVSRVGERLIGGAVLALLGLLLLGSGMLPPFPDPFLLQQLLAGVSLLLVLFAGVEWFLVWRSAPGPDGSTRCSSFLQMVDQLDRTVEQQKDGDHTGHRSGVEHDEKREGQHKNAGREEFEHQQKDEPEEAEKEGEGIGDQLREEKYQQSGDGRKRNQKPGRAKQKENDRQRQQITGDDVVEKIRPDEGKNTGHYSQQCVEGGTPGSSLPNGDLKMLHGHNVRSDGFRSGKVENGPVKRFGKLNILSIFSVMENV